MLHKLRRLIPTREQIERNRWLRWLGPSLLHPRLWHFSRRGVAVGVSLGVFFGLLVPIAQIPLAAGGAVLMRANVPAAVGATLVTNPLTFAPLYILAHRIGSAILGDTVVNASAAPDTEAEIEAMRKAEIASGDSQETGWWETTRRRIVVLGKPLLLGLAVLAVGAGIFTYWIIMLTWRIRTAWLWKRRRREGNGW